MSKNKDNRKKCLFLGYTNKKTKIISNIKKLKWRVTENGQKDVSFKVLKRYDLIISFGYKKLINKKILKKLKNSIINLHISYLPYNRGAHPNYWSFVEDTPSGVTIHEINDGVDTGNIIFQKKIYFKDLKRITFKNTYNKLIKEVEILFLKNIKKILNKKYVSKKQKKNGTYHKKKDLPKFINWNTNISNYLKKK